jgi:hypothetical protein
MFSTDDHGANWRSISAGNGIPDDHFVRVVREDPGQRGLLFAGTEFGLYISFDDGGRWQPFQLNLPATPISDMVVHRDDLVLGTQGRGFWILDDVSPLRQLGKAGDGTEPFLFKPRDVHRVEGGWREPGPYMSQDELLGGNIETDRVGENPPPGAMIFYNLPKLVGTSKDIRLRVIDGQGNDVRSFSSADQTLPSAPGMNRVVWDLSYPGANVIPGSRLDGHIGGPRAVPGGYSVRLEIGRWNQTQEFAVLMDPRSQSSAADLQEQFTFLLSLRDRITRTHDAVRTIQALRGEVDAAHQSLAAAKARNAGESARRDALLGRLGAVRRRILAELDDIEDHLRQRRAKVWQDTANFEPLLDDQFAWLASYTLSAATRPTNSAYERYADLSVQLEAQLARLDTVEREDVSSLRSMMREWKEP